MAESMPIAGRSEFRHSRRGQMPDAVLPGLRMVIGADIFNTPVPLWGRRAAGAACASYFGLVTSWPMTPPTAAPAAVPTTPLPMTLPATPPTTAPVTVPFSCAVIPAQPPVASRISAAIALTH